MYRGTVIKNKTKTRYKMCAFVSKSSETLNIEKRLFFKWWDCVKESRVCVVVVVS